MHSLKISPKYLLNIKVGGNNNFPRDKAGRCCLSQVIKVNVICDRMQWHPVPWHDIVRPSHCYEFFLVTYKPNTIMSKHQKTGLEENSVRFPSVPFRVVKFMKDMGKLRSWSNRRSLRRHRQNARWVESCNCESTLAKMKPICSL